jgi:polar amino acid transport system permease protein
MPLGTVIASLLQGFGTTCLIFVITLALAAPLGLVVAFGSMSRFTPLKLCTRAFVWIIRGSPLMLQLIIVFYGPGLIWDGEALPRFSATIVAFAINYAAYFSEIYRGGIESVPRGQYEAGLALGMTKSQIFFKITLLQVVKRILPPMSNEIITLVKDTSLARVIAVREIIMEAFSFTSKGFISPLFYAGVFYLVFNGILQIALGRAERKLAYFR